MTKVEKVVTKQERKKELAADLTEKFIETSNLLASEAEALSNFSNIIAYSDVMKKKEIKKEDLILVNEEVILSEKTQLIPLDDKEEVALKNLDNPLNCSAKWEQGRKSPLYQSSDTYDILKEMGALLAKESKEMNFNKEKDITQSLDDISNETTNNLTLIQKPIPKKQDKQLLGGLPSEIKYLESSYLEKMLGKVLKCDVVTTSGEVLGKKGEKITYHMIIESKNSGCLLKLMASY
jgi:hypothetical protein